MSLYDAKDEDIDAVFTHGATSAVAHSSRVVLPSPSSSTSKAVASAATATITTSASTSATVTSSSGADVYGSPGASALEPHSEDTVLGVASSEHYTGGQRPQTDLKPSDSIGRAKSGRSKGSPPKKSWKSLTRHEKVVQSLLEGHKIVRVGVPSYNITDDVVVYEVDVTNKRLRWNLWLRFEWFYVLHQMMCEVADRLSTALLPVRLPPFPSKKAKLLTDHFDPHFIENRRVLLENYLVKLLKNKYVRDSSIFAAFLTPPEDEAVAAGPSLPGAEEVARRMRAAILEDTSSSGGGDSRRGKRQSAAETTTELELSEAELFTPIPFYEVDESDEITDVTIPTAQILKHDHTIYQVHLVNSNERKSFSEWVVLKRYGDFARFHDELVETIEKYYPMELHKIPPLPPKFFKPLVDHLEETFIEKRRILLQCYLKRMLQHPTFRRLELTLVFLGAFS